MTPDNNALGFLDEAVEALRYENASLYPEDVAMRLAGRITEGARIIDVGCGTGVITEIIKNKLKADIIGIEPDKSRADLAKKRGLKVINNYLSLKLKNELGLFDYVIFADVLEHMPNPAEVVLVAREMLKPRGSILISVPNAVHIFNRVDLLKGVFNYEDCGIMDATHLRWFTRNSLKGFVERLGFKTIHQDYTVMPGLPSYQKRSPFRQLPPNLRYKLLCWLSKKNPNLFAVQHIIQAQIN